VCRRAKSGMSGGLMATALDSRLIDRGFSPGRGRCVVFLGKTLRFHSASFHPGI